MLAAATQLYRRHNAEQYAITQRELDQAHEQNAPVHNVAISTTSVETAVELALKETN